MKTSIQIKQILFISMLIMLNTTFAKGQGCAVSFTSPQAGSNVSGSVLVNGRATIPANGYLWVMAHEVGINGYWPQGNGPAVINNHEYEVKVKLGRDNEFGLFEVSAIVVDSQTNLTLLQWVHDAPVNNYSIPIQMPTAMENCLPVSMRLNKTSN